MNPASQTLTGSFQPASAPTYNQRLSESNPGLRTKRARSPDAAIITPEQLQNVRRIGGGGFGDVFLLEHSQLGPLALKCVKEEASPELVEDQRRVSGWDL